jgi:hypothetical protein
MGYGAIYLLEKLGLAWNVKVPTERQIGNRETRRRGDKETGRRGDGEGLAMNHELRLIEVKEKKWKYKILRSNNYLPQIFKTGS